MMSRLVVTSIGAFIYNTLVPIDHVFYLLIPSVNPCLHGILGRGRYK